MTTKKSIHHTSFTAIQAQLRLGLLGVLIAGAAMWACSTSDHASDTDSSLPDATMDTAVDSAPVDAAPVVDGGTPRLGLYTVKTDGTGLRLVLDTGTREISHARLSANGWLVGTRYGKDPDGNGLAMENEANIGAYYEGTQIVVFKLSAPSAQTIIAGSTVAGLAANPSWTDDGKVIFLSAEPDAGVLGTHIARASFSVVPTVSSITTVLVPSQLVIPVDPHQQGSSDATGTVSFSAAIDLAGKWQRPVWSMPASGTTSMPAVAFVGCPLCQSQKGCCAWTNFGDVLGTNDSRFSHAGTDIMWMQQHPDVSVPVGNVMLYPFRQVVRPLDGGPQMDLVAPATAATTTLSYGEWRADDQEIVYWSIEVEGSVLRQFLWAMSRDGSGRRTIPLPANLCPLHPSYVSASEIVFNAWRSAADGTCDVAKL